MTPYTKATDQYLAQRVNGATPEQLVALLLEGAQRFLAQAVQAMSKKDFSAKGHAINRVLAINEELALRVDLEGGSELATNLMRLYDWWGHEIISAGAALDPSRLESVSRQMGEVRQTWEQFHLTRVGAGADAGFQAGGMVG